ncbi:MAG: arginine N-succinyltransferase [Deltaproteobacteria bacterium]|nr:arginine N-succinyltransferase [Deltaproteobacteria bacterium]
MVIIRPVAETDLDALAELADMADFGLTSLPKDRDLLAIRIADSLRAFQIAPRAPGGELYIFVMEDPEAGKVVGTSCIVSKVGGFQPFYAYRIENVVHESMTLGVRKEVSILHLVTEHSGPCEIGGLFLVPEYRKHGNGRLLSLFRFLFMALRRERFEPLIIAEMRGVVDENGRSPFWEALGRRFFDMDFPKADYLSVKDKRFIAELMPKCPIYISLLPEEAQGVIGKVHPDTRPALKMLEDEGFRFSGMVDIFEAGPIVVARPHEIRIVKESRFAAAREITREDIQSERFLITNTAHDFRACMGCLEALSDGEIRIRTRVADALHVREGDQVCYAPLSPKKEPG